MATEGFVCWTECDGDIGPCQYITNRGGGIDFIARVNTVTKPSDATLITLQSAGSYLGIDCNIYRVIPIAPTVSTTTTTVAPITLTLTASCIGSGINGTGRIVANGFSGGTGTYANIRIGNTLSTALGATPIVLGGASSYQWDSLLNQTYYVVLTDSGNNSNYATVLVNCINTTTTTSTSTTSTTSTSTSTTSTTTLPINCNYNGGTAVVIYPTTTTSTSTTSTTSTTTAAASTTTTTTAAPTSTTTTTTSACNTWRINTSGNSGDGGCVEYYDCSNVYQTICVGTMDQFDFCAIGTPNQISGVGVNLSNLGPCTPTTTTSTTTSSAPVPTVSDCGGTANLAIANSTTGTYIGYTTPTDGVNDLSICTIGGSPLMPSSSDSFVGAFASSYYTEITNATGKQLRTWVGGTIFSTISIIGSPHLQYGDTGYGSSFVILEIID